MAIADHGLDGWQREELDRVGVRWIEHDKPDISLALMKSSVSAKEAWWKPWILEASPFDRSIWVDADAVIVGDISSAFDQVPFVTSQNLFQTLRFDLYERAAKYRFNGHPWDHALAPVSNINSGVVGVHRDCTLLTLWKSFCAEALQDGELMERCNVRDQTALVLAMMQMRINRQPLPTILGDVYNYPADGLSGKDMARRLDISRKPRELLQQAIERHPDAKIVHWLGRVKPWK